MKRTLVRYRTKPEKAQENERLIADVFQELRARSPAGVRYLVVKLADGTFVHFASVEDGASPVTALAAFQGLPGRDQRALRRAAAGRRRDRRRQLSGCSPSDAPTGKRDHAIDAPRRRHRNTEDLASCVN